MECPNCLEAYDTEGNRQPRIIITCGHSFCRKCVQGLRDNQDTLTCPQCKQISAEDDAPNVALMSYIEMQKTRSIPSKVRQINVPRQAVVCQHCNQNDAKYICFDCLPHNGFRFCSECMLMEHDRPFGPVQKHRPRPIEEVKYGAILPDCPRHPAVSCDLFSFVENRFACDECKNEPDFDPEQFVDIGMAVQQVREEIPPLISKVQLLRERLQETQVKVRDHLSHLDQSKMTAIDKARVEFQDFEMSLRKRLAFVESQVEDNAANRKRILNDQLEKIEVAMGATATSVIQANMLNQMQDYSLLQRASNVIQQMRTQIQGQQDDYVNEPVVSTEISVYVTPDFQQAIDKLGVVSGSTTVQEFTCTVHKGVILLRWKEPEDPVKKYEILGDALFSESAVATSTSPAAYLVEGKENSRIVDGLMPGVKYRFRIRSEDEGGWSSWSPSIIGMMPDWPLEIGFTGKIIKLVIPKDGLYRIEARGAKAMDGERRKGGRGAVIAATFPLDQNDFLIILVGGSSTRKGPSSGGAGGTFVGLNGRQNLLVAAGGGGGTRGYDDEDQDGKDANTEAGGLAGHGREWAQGGNGGRSGKDAIYTGPCWGYGGAGHIENSSTAQSFVAGGQARDGGGFGGGGAVGIYGGGGGGGYSGGGGGRGGGGGGSYVRDDGFDIKKAVCNDEGHGLAIINLVADA